MITKLVNKINILSSTNGKILVLGNIAENILEMLNNYFKTVELLDFTDESSQIINNTLLEQFDIVIFSLNKESIKYIDVLNEHSNIFKNSLVLLEENLYVDFKPYVNSVNSLLVYPLEEKQLLDKIYVLLALTETESLIKTKQKLLRKYEDDDTNKDIDTFLDQYSGQIMFINDDINENLERLNNFEFNQELFSSFAANLFELNDIFKKDSHLDTISDLFLEFGQFLDSLDLEKIDPSRYNAFDYLANIIEDLTIYIDELFIYRILKDVKIFSDSMQNNISYFEAALFGHNENGDEENLEFF